MKRMTIFALCVCCGTAYAESDPAPSPNLPTLPEALPEASAPAPIAAEPAPSITPETFASKSFENMLIHVYQSNPKLNAERDALKMADEKVSQANSGFRPNLSGQLGTGSQREKVDSGDWQYGQATNASLVLTQPLFSGFGTIEQKRAAEARVQAGRARLLAIEQSTFFTAISDWLDVCEKEYVLALNEQNVSRLIQYGDNVRQRFQAGDGTQTDVAQAESRIATAQARYAQALADRDSARATFTRDTGLPAQQTDLPSIPTGLPQSRDEVHTLALNNPALIQAGHEEEAARHDIETAKSSIWPKIYLRGSMSEERSPALGLDRLRDDSITLNMTIPLYQGGAEYSRVREAKRAREKSREDAIDIEREVVERADISWNDYQAAKTVIEAASRALDASDKALAGVEEEQRQGLRTVTEVLDEQTERLNAQITHIQAQKNARLESYRLLASIGQLTPDGLHLQTERYDPTIHHDEVAGQWLGF